MENNYNYNWYNFDKELMKDFNWFLHKINKRACINYGFIKEKYEAVNRFGQEDWGLGEDVEYFHPTITLDDRMRYICQVIVKHPMSEFNVLGNTIISHFYGARGVHQTITGSLDPNNCFVDFDEVANDNQDYIKWLRSTVEKETKINKKPVWGTTELHTPIQAAARNYCREKYDNKDRPFHTIDVIEWVASFKDNGIAKALLHEVDHLKDAFKALTKHKGIGEYYGFHCSTSTSVIPQAKYHHDQRFVAPGPGARYTINKIWPEAPKSLYAEAVYFLRENADEIGLTENVEFHPDAWNIDNTFTFPQDSLKYYGTEVLSCQFGIYLQIRNNKNACNKRKVSRIDSDTNNTLEGFLS